MADILGRWSISGFVVVTRRPVSKFIHRSPHNVAASGRGAITWILHTQCAMSSSSSSSSGHPAAAESAKLPVIHTKRQLTVSIPSSSSPRGNDPPSSGTPVSKQQQLFKSNRFAEFLSSSPDVAAGVPVLELIRKLEEEKILDREDRKALQEALVNPARREQIVQALRDVELGSNQRFSVRRLKALIHQNGAGAPLSVARPTDGGESATRYDVTATDLGIINEDQSMYLSAESFSASSDPNLSIAAPRPREAAAQGPLEALKERDVMRRTRRSQEDDNNTQATAEVAATISQVVGEEPMYYTPQNFNVCDKISKRLKDFVKSYKPSYGPRKFAVLIGNGSCNPLTRMHMRSFFLAKQHLETYNGYVVLGSLISPAHGHTVRERYRFHPSEIIPSPHRLAIAQLMLQDSKWLTIDPWELTRRRAMDYISLLDHFNEVMKEHLPMIEVKVLYVCKANLLPKLSPQTMRSKNCGCVVVSRPPESDLLGRSLGSKWSGVVHIVEDAAILDSSMDVVSSRKVREKMMKGQKISQFLGDSVQSYVKMHKLGQKMKGEERWSEDELCLPKISSRQWEFQFQHTLNSYSLTGAAGSLSSGLKTAGLSGLSVTSDVPISGFSDEARPGSASGALRPPTNHRSRPTTSGLVLDTVEEEELLNEELPESASVASLLEESQGSICAVEDFSAPLPLVVGMEGEDKSEGKSNRYESKQYKK